MEIYKIYKYSPIFTDYYKALEHAEKLARRGYTAAVVNMFGENWRVRYN